VGSPLLLSDDVLTAAGLPRADIFNLEAPVPIPLEAVFVTDPAELRGVGIDPDLLPLGRVRIAVELRWMGHNVAYTLLRFEAGDDKDLVSSQRTPAESTLLASFASLVSVTPRAAGGLRMARIPVERLASPALALTLYDARDATEIEISRRWMRFADIMANFTDVIGEGTFIVTYDRKANEARLLYETQSARIPLRLLGSGVQQLAALLGHVVVTGATIVGIEEPELNLRYTMQLRLREVLSRLVGGPGGLDQLFITSHSDAFETGTHFYLMEPTPDGPRIEKRGVEGARAALGITAESTPPDPKAALCYLSTDGVVRVPDRIRSAIGLPRGGGVVFLERDGAAEMMSDGTFADRFEPKRAAEGDDDA